MRLKLVGRCCPLLISILVASWSTPHVFAHSGKALTPDTLWVNWEWNPLVLMGLATAGWLYARGVRTLWRSAGVGRGIAHHQAILFYSGLLVAFVALISPLAALSKALFSAHMVQHVLLMNVAAPLLVWGTQPSLLFWAAPHPTRRSLARWWKRQVNLRKLWGMMNQPLFVWLLFAATLWFWHAPLLYEAAIANEGIHFGEHVSFTATALLFWWMVDRQRDNIAWNWGASILFLFTTALHSGLLAALITFAPQPLYPIYAQSAQTWGIDLLTDQQLAGVIMWVPVGFVYLGAVLWRIGRQLSLSSSS